MGCYKIEWRKSTAKDLRKIEKSAIGRIIKAVEKLSEDPRPVSAKKLKGSDEAYRIRIGDFRVVYEIYDGRLIVEVIKVGNRRDVYRKK